MIKSWMLISAAALSLILLTPAAAQAAPVDHIRTCGIVTCSDYYSHRVTVAMDNLLQKGDTGPLTVAAFACPTGVGGGVALTAKLVGAAIPGVGIVMIPCTVLAAVDFAISRAKDIIHHAATTNGCVRFRSPRFANKITVGLYADHSRTCHSMD